MPCSYVRTLCLIGIMLSSYAIYVEHRKSSSKFDDFTALCDIPAIGASCSKALTLPEVPRDSILDISNAFIGFIYYAIVLSLEQTMAVSSLGSHRLWLIFTLIINCLAMSVSIYLAIKLIYLREICILCWTTHVLNFLLLRNYWRVSRRISFKKNL